MSYPNFCQCLTVIWVMVFNWVVSVFLWVSREMSWGDICFSVQDLCAVSSQLVQLFGRLFPFCFILFSCLCLLHGELLVFVCLCLAIALALLWTLFARLALEGLASLTNCEAVFARYFWDSLHSLFLRFASSAYSANCFARYLRDLLHPCFWSIELMALFSPCFWS